MLLVRVAWRNLGRHKGRTLISVSAIAGSLFLALFFIAFAEGVYTGLIDDAVRLDSGHFTFQHGDYAEAPAVDLVVPNSGAMRDTLEGVEGVQRVKLQVLGQGVAQSSRGSIGVGVFGVEPDLEREVSPLARKIVRGSYLEAGQVRRAVVGTRLAERLKLEVGKKLVITTNNAKGELVGEMVRVQGIFELGSEEMDAYLVQVPIEFARKLFGLHAEDATRVAVLLEDGERRPELLAEAKMRAGQPNIDVLTWEQAMPDLAAYVAIDGGGNLVFQGLIIFLSLFTIFNTIVMSVVERRRELAMLLALGTPPRRVQAMVLVESAMLALIGCVIGLGLGSIASAWLQVAGLDVSSLYEEGVAISGYALDTHVYALLTPTMVFALGGVVFGATLLISLYAVRRVPRLPIVELLR